MWIGKDTADVFEEFFKNGLCQDHLIDFKDDHRSSFELQRKALLFIRLQLIGPLLFKKKFASDKIRALLSVSKYFPNRDKPEEELKDLKKTILILDAVVVYTICKFSKVCCIGILFKQNKPLCGADSKEKKFILDLLSKDVIKEEDISYYNEAFQNNFSSCENGLIKISYVVALLFARTVTRLKHVKSAIDEISAELQYSSKDCELYLAIGKESYEKKAYKEALISFEKALSFNNFCRHTILSRGNAYLAMNKIDDAILDFYLAHMIDPQDLDVNFKLSTCLVLQKKKEEAELFCKKVIMYYSPNRQNTLQGCLRNHLDNLSNPPNSKEPSTISKDFNANDNSQKEDVPDLLEASDSDENIDDLPELSDASNSGDSDIEDIDSSKPTTKFLNFATQTPKLSTKFAIQTLEHSTSLNTNASEPSLKVDLVESTKQEPVLTSVKPIQVEEKDLLADSLKEGSEALTSGNNIAAIGHFRTAIKEIKDLGEKCKLTATQIDIVKYLYGIALCRSSSYEDIDKGISVLAEAIESPNNIKAVFEYSLGLAYFKLNRFKNALEHFERAEKDIKPGLTACMWPGSSTVIKETEPDHIKASILEMKAVCGNPPPPAATCRFEGCCSHQPEIYFSDVNFKGFYSVECSEQCFLDYHVQCWKTLKNIHNCTDKDFLEKKCLTPDCDGLIIKIENTEKEGVIGKQFCHADPKKLTKPKNKPVKKGPNIEEKKRKRKDSTSKSEHLSEDLNEEIQTQNDEDMETKNDASKAAEVSNTTENSLSHHSGSFVKKEKLVDEVPHKIQKTKENKKSKNTLSFSEFVKMTGGINESQEHEEADEKGAREYYNYIKQMSNEDSSPYPPINGQLGAYGAEAGYFPEISTRCDGSTNDFSTSHLPSVEINLPIEESIKRNVYSYLKDILSQSGPLKVDAPILVDELKNFPSEASILIADAGGIGKFLSLNSEFAFVHDKYVCVAEDVAHAYKLSSRRSPLPSFGFDDLPAGVKLTPVSQLNPAAKEYVLKSNSKEYSLNPVAKDFLRFSITKEYKPDPNAKEYVPTTPLGATSKKSQSSPKDIGNLDDFASKHSTRAQSLPVDNKKIEKSCKDVGSLESFKDVQKTSPCSPTLKAVSKLRQPLVVENGATKVQLESSLSKPETPPEKKTLSAHEKQVAEQLKNVIKVYFHSKMDHCRTMINEYLRPYTIAEFAVEEPDSNGIYTIKEKVPKLSKGTMKTDKELERLTTLTNVLLREKNDLTQKLNAANQKCDSVVDSSESESKKHVQDLELARSEITRLEEQLKLEKEEQSNFKEQYEEDKAQLQDKLEITEANSVLVNSQLEELKEEFKGLKEECSHLQDEIKLLETEKEALKSAQINEGMMLRKLHEVNLEKEKAKERAQKAEHFLLKFKKTEYMKKIDAKIAEAAQRMKELEDGIPLLSANLDPIMVANLKSLKNEIMNYIKRLGAIGGEFIKGIDEQINLVNNGEPLASLKNIQSENIPDVPSYVPQLPMPNAMFNAATPSWTSQIQRMNTSMNSNLPQPLSVNTQMNVPNVAGQISPMICSTEVPTKTLPGFVAGKPLQSVTPALSQTLPAAPVLSKLMPAVPGTSKTTPVVPVLSSASNASVNASTTVGKPVQAITAAKLPVATVVPQSSTENARSSPVPRASKPPRMISKSAQNVELDYKSQTAKRIGENIPTAIPSQEKPNVETKQMTSYEKLLYRLNLKFPDLTQSQLTVYIKEFRDQRNSKLSGLSMDVLVDQISAVIERKRLVRAQTPESVPPFRTPQPRSPPKNVVNKRLVDNNAKQQQQQPSTTTKCPWANKNDGGDNSKWSGGSPDDSCIICYEDMNPRNSYKVDCGHRFHQKCIRLWLSKKSDCPICRVHLLLPEDYPALS